MSTPKQCLEAVLAPLMKTAGYQKRSLTWRRNNSDTISVFNVQKSEWGDQFYINCAIYLKAIGSEELPPARRCHVQSRMDRLVPDRDHCVELLDFETEIGFDDRLQQIAALVEGYGLPWLRTYSRVSSLRELVEAEQSSNIAIRTVARTYLCQAPS